MKLTPFNYLRVFLFGNSMLIAVVLFGAGAEKGEDVIWVQAMYYVFGALIFSYWFAESIYSLFIIVYYDKEDRKAVTRISSGGVQMKDILEARDAKARMHNLKTTRTIKLGERASSDLDDTNSVTLSVESQSDRAKKAAAINNFDFNPGFM